MIASIIDSYVTEREEFQLVRGYQPFDSLFYVIRGSFLCDFGNGEEKIGAGDIAIFNSRSPMKRHVTEPISFLYIKFSQRQEGTFSVPSRAVHELSERERFDVLRLLSLSEDRTKTSFALREHYLNDLLISIFGEPFEDSARKAPAALPTVLDRPVEFMRENLESKISLADIARAAGMSQSSLENKFSELLEVSVYDYLICLRMERAKALLSETSLPVSDIARRCGYENQFYFCNAFKKNTGMTPTEYRKIKKTEA